MCSLNRIATCWIVLSFCSHLFLGLNLAEQKCFYYIHNNNTNCRQKIQLQTNHLSLNDKMINDDN